ncbi:MAG TPA: multiheme c-type cytochrome [Enhygromyxa sp.]|nr:multiheme c-type cytochrome [Enhygromyxa sp.]
MSLSRERGLIGALWAVALTLAGASSLVRAQRVATARASIEARDAELPKLRGEGFIGSERCRSCHPQAYETWHASWHRTMTQKVGPQTVIAQFDGRSLPHVDGEHAVEQRGDEFWVRMPEANWLLDRAERGPEAVSAEVPMMWQRAVMSTGAHNMQMYWVAAEPGRRLVAFPFSWSVEARTWVANEATLLRPHEPYVVYGWNEVCVQCHAVAGAPEFSPTRVETEVAELGIACEACHGPGQEHVRAQSQPLRRYLNHLDDAGESAIVHPGRLAGHRSAEICGQCHSASVFPDHAAWLGRGSDYRAGAALADSTRVVRHPIRADQPWIEQVLDEDPDYLAGRFWGDGMIRISGREYNGMLESPCSADGDFGCLSCHEMHGDTPNDQLRPLAREDDDRQCTQCHARWIDASELESHTRHPAESSGSRCVNCHMPHTVYGLTKAIRSHQISIPSVEESELHGRLNACNACHLDRSLAWTAAQLQAWGRASAPSIETHEPARGVAVEHLVRGDAGQRALAAWAFGWAPAREASGADWMAPLLVRALADDYAAVRWIALRSLRSLPGFELLDWAYAGALEGQPADAATLAQLHARWPGSARVDAAVYANHDGFDEPAWRHDHDRRDERVVDLRE